MGRDDYCPEDARAFSSWSALGSDCGHDSECTPDGECIECLRLGAEDDARADHESDAAWEREQDDAMYARTDDAWEE